MTITTRSVGLNSAASAAPGADALERLETETISRAFVLLHDQLARAIDDRMAKLALSESQEPFRSAMHDTERFREEHTFSVKVSYASLGLTPRRDDVLSALKRTEPSTQADRDALATQWSLERNARCQRFVDRTPQKPSRVDDAPYLFDFQRLRHSGSHCEFRVSLGKPNSELERVNLDRYRQSVSGHRSTYPPSADSYVAANRVLGHVLRTIEHRGFSDSGIYTLPIRTSGSVAIARAFFAMRSALLDTQCFSSVELMKIGRNHVMVLLEPRGEHLPSVEETMRGYARRMR